MLVSLQVQNYALIKELKIGFGSGFSIITGETGAGKSILLGALSLLLGQRADTTVMMDKQKKCVVEGIFEIKKYALQPYFTENDIDYEDNTIIRREIIPGGKSRAFINDTPVSLNQLRELGLKLVDIHSQHENLNLGKNLFQLIVIDTVAQNGDLLKKYTKFYSDYLDWQQELGELTERAKQAQADLDYYSYQYQQLDDAKLQPGELNELEMESNTLNHAEEIKFNLLKAGDLVSGDGISILGLLKDAIESIDKLSGFFPLAKDLRERLDSVYIELKDIASDCEVQGESVDIDPGRLQYVQERLDQLYSLMHKHSISTVEELIRLKDDLEQKVNEIASFDEQINKLTKKIDELQNKLKNLSEELSNKRQSVISQVEEKVISILKQVGIPNARFSVLHSRLESFSPQGTDKVEFLFSANKQAGKQEIGKVASGGELSRLMLAIKSLISSSLELPTIIFDEVDAGVSGEIAEKVGLIMKSMSEDMQVINITHLPQVAAKGDYHYLVYKYDQEKESVTDIRLLDSEERVLELAKMLSGEELTEAAISNARELLN
jgi:DNA repair protein RecN (Recombination protein N)